MVGAVVVGGEVVGEFVGDCVVGEVLVGVPVGASVIPGNVGDRVVGGRVGLTLSATVGVVVGKEVGDIEVG